MTYSFIKNCSRELAQLGLIFIVTVVFKLPSITVYNILYCYLCILSEESVCFTLNWLKHSRSRATVTQIPLSSKRTWRCSQTLSYTTSVSSILHCRNTNSTQTYCWTRESSASSHSCWTPWRRRLGENRFLLCSADQITFSTTPQSIMKVIYLCREMHCVPNYIILHTVNYRSKYKLGFQYSTQ